LKLKTNTECIGGAFTAEPQFEGQKENKKEMEEKDGS